MTLTVVVPAYNVANYIDQCLASLIGQTHSDWRCVIVDDGSTDDTVVKVRDYQDPRIRLITQPNGGVSAARNRGFAEVETPYVMFLDGDDFLHPTAFQRLVQPLSQEPETVAAYGALRKALACGAPYPGEKPLRDVSYPSGDVLQQMVRENFLANGGHLLARSAAVRRAGGFRPDLRLSEDWEFWCRLALVGPFRFIGAPPEVFTLRVSAGSSSGGLSADWHNHLHAVNAVLFNAEISARFTAGAWKRLTRQVWASHRWEAGRVNFTRKNFPIARKLMIKSLQKSATPKRLALFGIAQLSQLLDRSLTSRLRFYDDDALMDEPASAGHPR